MTYAEIKNGVVENLVEIAHNANDFPGYVAVEDRPVQIGDTYDGGAFYHNGEKVKNAYDMLADAEAENQEVFAILKGEA